MKYKNQEMLPRERVLALFNHKDCDKCAAITPTSVANQECMKIAGVSFPSAHTNASDMAALAATAHTVLGFDSVMPYFSIHLEAEMLGCKIDWKNNHTMPTVIERPLNKPEDFNPPKNFLKKPLCRELLLAIRMLKKRLGNDVVIIGKVMGPWSLMYNLYGVENLLLDAITEPDRIFSFIDRLLPISIEFARAQFDAGADIVTWADHVTSDLASAKMYEEFILPAHKKVNWHLAGDKKIILHTCGNVMDRLHLIQQAGFDAFHIDSRNNLTKAVEIAGNSMLLSGAVNNPITLLNGQKKQIEQEVLNCAHAGIHLISPECAIPFTVSNKSLITLVNAAHKISIP